MSEFLDFTSFAGIDFWLKKSNRVIWQETLSWAINIASIRFSWGWSAPHASGLLGLYQLTTGSLQENG